MIEAPSQALAQDCPLCGASRHAPLKRFSDGVVVGRCLDCGLLFTPIRHAHPEGLLDGHSVSDRKLLYGPIVSGRARHFRERNFCDYLRILARHGSGKRLLDVGCAHGFFLSMARSAGYEATGIEPGAAIAAFAREALDLRILGGRLDEVDLGDERWDVVSLTDSAEYLPNPLADLGRITGNLEPGGILLLKVPNGDYFRLRHRFERLLRLPATLGAFSPSRRVVHYTRDSIRRLLERLDLEILEIGSMSGADSPVWPCLTGLWLEMESPWYLGFGPKLLRRILHIAGRAESAATGQDHLSQSIFAVGRKRGGS